MISPLLLEYQERGVLSGALWRSFADVKLDKADTAFALALWCPLGALSTDKGFQAVTHPCYGSVGPGSADFFPQQQRMLY